MSDPEKLKAELEACANAKPEEKGALEKAAAFLKTIQDGAYGFMLGLRLGPKAQQVIIDHCVAANDDPIQELLGMEAALQWRPFFKQCLKIGGETLVFACKLAAQVAIVALSGYLKIPTPK